MKKIISLLVIFMLMSVSTVPMAVFTNEEEYNAVKVNSIMKDTDIENLKAKSAILIDAATGNILYEHNSQEKLPMASITKIMTTLLIMEEIKKGNITYEDKIPVSANANGMGGSQVYLEIGENDFTLREMLKAIEIHSANDAAVAVAEKIAGTESAFVQMMNKKAEDLSMNGTHFYDCTGLAEFKDDHYSTALDIAIMSKELITKHPEIFEFTTTWYASFRGDQDDPDHQDLWNRNRLIKTYPGANGLKTGFTSEAGHCISATALRDGFQLIAVVLGEPDTNTRFAEAAKLLDYGFLNFETINVDKQGAFVEDFEVEKGIETKVAGILEKDAVFLIKKDDKDDIEKIVTKNNNITAPVEEGQKLGEIEYKIGDKTLGTVSIVAETKVDKASFFKLLIRMILNWLGIGK